MEMMRNNLFLKRQENKRITFIIMEINPFSYNGLSITLGLDFRLF